MADEGLRRLERRVRAGDTDALARLLRERVRHGELPVERLRLLHLLDDRLATRALDEEPLAEMPLQDWVRLLEPLGPEVLVRTAVALARAVLRRDEPYSVRAIRGAEAWVLQQDVERAREAGLAADSIADRRRAIDDRLHDSVEAAEAAARVAQFATLPVAPFPPRMDSPYWLRMCAGYAGRACPGGEAEAREKVRDDLEPWALMRGDPIAARRAGRSGIDDASVEGAPIS